MYLCSLASALDTSKNESAVKALPVIVGLCCGACAAPSPYQHSMHDPMNTLVEPLARPPQCVVGGGDTLTSNVYFEFQVAKRAIARDRATVELMSKSNKSVLLSFVVDTAGVPRDGTVASVFVGDSAGARLAEPVVAQLRFTPAEVEGCRVQQLVQDFARLPSVK